MKNCFKDWSQSKDEVKMEIGHKLPGCLGLAESGQYSTRLYRRSPSHIGVSTCSACSSGGEIQRAIPIRTVAVAPFIFIAMYLL